MASPQSRNLAARQSATKHRVDRLDAERDERRRIAAFERRPGAVGQRSIELPFAKCGFNERQRVVLPYFRQRTTIGEQEAKNSKESYGISLCSKIEQRQIQP